jgi:PAS domain S-box-containing protein
VLTETLQHVKVPSVIVDADGTIRWLNDAAERIFGEVRGRDFTAVIVPEDAPRARKEFARKLRGAPVTDYEVDVITADGRRARAEISSVPVGGGGRCHGIFGLVLVEDAEASGTTAPKLTPRQSEVLLLLARGSSTEQIATALYISPETVRNHIRHVLRALGAHSRLEAVAKARQVGLLPR